MASNRISQIHGSPKTLHQTGTEVTKIHRPASLVAPHLVSSSLTSQAGVKSRHIRGHSLGQIASPVGKKMVHYGYSLRKGNPNLKGIYSNIKESRQSLGQISSPVGIEFFIVIENLYIGKKICEVLAKSWTFKVNS